MRLLHVLTEGDKPHIGMWGTGSSVPRPRHVTIFVKPKWSQVCAMCSMLVCCGSKMTHYTFMKYRLLLIASSAHGSRGGGGL